MASVTDLQATVSLGNNNICEGTSTNITVRIKNTLGKQIGFVITSINDNDIEIYNTSTDDYTYINSGQTGTLTQNIYINTPGEHVFTVTIKYILDNSTTTTNLTSPVLYVSGNLETPDGKIIDDLMIEDKRIVQLDCQNQTIWKNGVWFQSNPKVIGPDPDNITTPVANINGNFYNHNHLIKNQDVDIYQSNCLTHKSLVNPFDFFTEYGALTVTRTLNGFTASGEQQATYTCKTSIETDMIISFDIINVSPKYSQDVYFEVFTSDPGTYEQINLSAYGANSNVKIEFTSIRGFKVYLDNELDDEYYYENNAYHGFRFNIGGGNITIDNFIVEKKLSSSELNSDKINVSGLDVYRSYQGTRFKTNSNSNSLLLGGTLPTSFARLEVDVVKIKGTLLLYQNEVNLTLSDLVPDNSHLTITVDKNYIEIFINGQLIKSIKENGGLPYFLFFPYGECVFKNIEVYSFPNYETVTINNNGNANITYSNQDRGNIYFVGDFENLPTIPFYIEDCTYTPTFTESTGVIKQATNNNAYEYDSENNIGYFKGSILSNGWSNAGLWECTFDLAYNHGGARYTGLILLTRTYNVFTDKQLNWGIENWEGPITGTPKIKNLTTQYVKDGHLTSLGEGQVVSNSNNGNPTIDWHTIHMRKESSTCLVVWKNNDYTNRVTYQWEDLEYAPQVTIGGRTNITNPYNGAVASDFGSTCIKNLRVKVY